MARGPLDLWNAWGTQILVLLSLTLQILLLLFAGIRRRKSSVVVAVLRFILWLAYQLADSTAIYTVGHLSLSSAPRKHKLVAFWAPFLLLHLGGPDNITAYSLEDNKLWKRHLVTLVVQVLGAEYVLYKNILESGGSIVVASILMFIVGTAKYGERTWALYSANFSSIQAALKKLPRTQLRGYQGYLREEDGHIDTGSEEFLLQRAHSLFHICERGIVDSVIDADKTETESKKVINRLQKSKPEWMWRVMEMELSLMYDTLYTKARVIHSMFGYLVRTASPLAVVASFLLFHFSGKRGHSRVDITITYTLLAGALLIETTSTLNAVGSSWALSYLCNTEWSGLRHAALCAGRWHRLRRAVVTIRQFIKTMTGGSSSLYGRSRRWSGTIGQYNMLYVRSSLEMNKMDRRLNHFATKLSLGDWWENTYYSWTIEIPEKVRDHVVSMLSRDYLNTMGMLRYKWGEIGLNDQMYSGLFKMLDQAGKDSSWHGVDFHESIISWHIATELVLSELNGNDEDEYVGPIRALSNYLVYLLVTRPDMLPGLPQNWLYEMTCENLDDICHGQLGPSDKSGVSAVLKKLIGRHGGTRPYKLDQTNQLADIILHWESRGHQPEIPRLKYAREIAKIVLEREEDKKDILFDLWTDFLIYAANRCNRESHSRNLNTGGEFTTVVWLMIEHIYQTK